MEPCNFKEANKILQKPAEMTDKECQPLSVFSDGDQCISKWKINWPERLHCLFYGYIWVFVRSGSTQPPIALKAYKTAFEDEK